jgi:hypothetical protein
MAFDFDEFELLLLRFFSAHFHSFYFYLHQFFYARSYEVLDRLWQAKCCTYGCLL